MHLKQHNLPKHNSRNSTVSPNTTHMMQHDVPQHNSDKATESLPTQLSQCNMISPNTTLTAQSPNNATQSNTNNATQSTTMQPHCVECGEEQSD